MKPAKYKPVPTVGRIRSNIRTNTLSHALERRVCGLGPPALRPRCLAPPRSCGARNSTRRSRSLTARRSAPPPPARATRIRRDHQMVYGACPWAFRRAAAVACRIERDLRALSQLYHRRAASVARATPSRPSSRRCRKGLFRARGTIRWFRPGRFRDRCWRGGYFRRREAPRHPADRVNQAP